MRIEEIGTETRGRGGLKEYIEIIKPRETALLVFIGLVTSLVAAGGALSAGRGVIIFLAVLAASAGANSLTNYLDRDLDARMTRTSRRALPSGRIYPAEKALFFCGALTLTGLVLAWYLSPLAFLADLVGTAAAVIYRKRVTCVFPQGAIASCAPIMMGWLAVRSSLNWEIFLLCLLIIAWLPSHIWSIMTAHRDDYIRAGITWFPLNCSLKSISRVLFAFCLLMYTASIALYFTGDFGMVFLIIANIIGPVAVFASLRLMMSRNSRDAWKLYKISAFPYLGLLFLAIAVDLWTRM
ncbi:MAG: protoheme IX farnesyltransferase [Dehalococcoidales bacterium]|nr:protoheme IX farnesyltransferase [Dehalococcoidales bacterium]